MSTEPPAHLARGKACTPCRRRKMKCDGNKPQCNQCVRFGRPNECEYNEVAVPSTARVLEQHIARLQSRIQELEQDDPTLVRLHDPHAAYRQSAAASSSATRQEWWEMPEPPPRVAQVLINQFLPHASKFGFFLDINRFMTALFTPTVSKPRPSSVLRNALYLWGTHLSQDQQYKNRESLFLSRSLRSIHVALSNAQQQDTFYTLQAEVLLAYYFFHNGRLIEGKFHSNAAVSLAIMCQLHKIASPHRNRTASGSQDLLSMGQFQLSLSPPKDAVEEGERIHAWWTTFILDKCWVVALASPSTIVEDESNSSTRIDTPWPMDLDQYGQVPLPPNPGRTIQTFMDNLVSGRLGRETSFLAVHAKAATLYERATRLALQWGKNVADHQNDFISLDTCIERFKQTLPSIDQVEGARTLDNLHNLLLVHTLAQCATIQLHHPFSLQSSSSTSRSRCLTAANAIIRVLHTLPIRSLKCVNPIIAVLWTSASDVLVCGLRSLRTSRSAWASSSALPGDDALVAAMDNLATATEHFASTSPFMGTQLMKIRQARAGI